MSDLHIGRVTSSYNPRIAVKRMLNFMSNFERIKLKINRSCKIPVLNIFLLGDIIDGENVYPGQAYESTAADPSIDLALKLFENFISFLRGKIGRPKFRKIKFWCVKGNHGRVSKHGSKQTNFDVFFYKRLKDRLEKKGIEVNVTNSWYNFAEVCGHRYLLIHGNQIYTYMNIPYYGISQRIMKWEKSLGSFDAACLGHFHTVGYYNLSDVPVLLNGTFLTDDDYSLQRIGLKPATKFWFFGVDERKPVTWMHLVDVL